MRKWIGVVALAVIARASGPAAAGGEPRPFPVDRTQIVKDGVFVVEGRKRIPVGVEITVQKGTKIVGKEGADGPGVIEVEGKLTVQGVYGDIAVLEDVTIELQRKFGDLFVASAEFRGKSLGIGTPKDTPVEGRVRIYQSSFSSPATMVLTMTGSSSVDLRGTYYYADLGVKAVAAAGTTGSDVKLWMKQCTAGRTGWKSGLYAEGLSQVEIRESELGGDATSFVDCAAVAIDSCYVFSKTLEFRQTVTGRFAKCGVKSCDLQCEKIDLVAPALAGSPEKMQIENCWFGGETKVSAIRAKIIGDKDDEPERGVIANVGRVSAKPLQLSWTIFR